MDAWKQTLKIPVSALFLLGTCPVLAGADSFWNGVLLGATAVAAFALTEVVIYLLRGVVTGGAKFVTLLATASALAGIALLLVEAYFPLAYAAVGLYVPLTALQAVGLDRVLSDAEAPAALSKLARPACWYVVILAALGLLREFLGAGTLFGLQVLPSYMEALAFFRTIPGAFLTLAFLAMGAKGLGLVKEEAPQ